MKEQGHEAEAPDAGILASGSPIREILIRATKMRVAADALLESTEKLDGDESKVLVERTAVKSLEEAVELWSQPVE